MLELFIKNGDVHKKISLSLGFNLEKFSIALQHSMIPILITIFYLSGAPILMHLLQHIPFAVLYIQLMVCVWQLHQPQPVNNQAA